MKVIAILFKFRLGFASIVFSTSSVRKLVQTVVPRCLGFCRPKLMENTTDSSALLSSNNLNHRANRLWQLANSPRKAKG